MMRRRASGYATAVIVGLVAACNTPARTSSAGIGARDAPGPAARIPSDTVSQLRGTLFITGSEPAAALTLQRSDGTSVTLVGDLTGELRRLAGATVVVYGAQAPPAPVDRFAVQRYDILSINGQTPVVGTLRVDGGMPRLVTSDDTVPLIGIPDALRDQDGAKVWITGRRTDRGLEVQSYGVVRPRQE